MENKRIVGFILVGVIALILLSIFGSSMFVTIQSGEKGVIFRRFGGGLDKENVFQQGFHVKAPWNQMIVYNVRKQEQEETMDVLSSNGLAIGLDLSIRYKVIDNKIGFLHDNIGINFLKDIIIPEVRSSTRKVIGQYTPEELYSTKRDKIQEEIEDDTRKALEDNYVLLDALLIRSVQLPDKIKEAIERKLQQEQQAQEYEFRIEKEKKEAERKRIEAKGIQDFQRIVTEGISDKLLKWKGIEATQELAASENSKIIVIGSGEDQLPVILNSDK